jgi:hypothetical protein
VHGSSFVSFGRNYNFTTLAKNSPKFASLRTTISMSIIIRWKKLKEGDKLDWSREVKNGCMVAMVKRVGTNNNNNKK